MRCLLALATCWCVLVACGTETGNPEAVPLTYNATSSAPARILLGDDGSAPVQVDQVWLRLDDVRLLPCGGAAPGIAEGLGLADHGGPEAALQTVELEEGTYCGLQTTLLGEQDPVVEPAGIAGAAVALTGSVDGRPFTIVTEADHPIDLVLAAVRPPEDGSWLLTFDVAEWIDVGALRSLEGDSLRVDASTEPALLGAFEDRLTAGVQLWADLDGDGRIDDDDQRLDR